MEKKKTNFLRRGLALVLALTLVVGTFLMIPTQAADTSALGKLIDTFGTNNNVFNLTATSRFFVTAEPTGELLQTIQLVQRQFAADKLPTATPLDIVWGDSGMVRSGDILIRLVNSSAAPAGVGAEGYKLEVNSYATVTAIDVDGLLYGLNMLQKHFRNAGTNSLRGFTAVDTPDTAQRAVSLDCARKYLTKNYICNYIREMSWMGYNTLQLHFSEDGGFRIDIWDEAYYKDYNGDGTAYQPANDFSWLCGSHTQYWTGTYFGVDYSKDPDANKYLTTAELVEIIETAKEYHIDVIPSFDCPAHLDYATWKYEQNYKANTSYSFKSTYDNKTYYAKDINGCINYKSVTGASAPNGSYAVINITQPQAKAFLFEMYIDLANFFKEYAGSTKFSIGADEVTLSSSTWSYNDFVYFTNELNTLLNNKGYTMMMYNDFVGTTNYTNTTGVDFADNIEILYWDSPYNASATSSSNTWKGHTATVQDYIDEGRTLYNCIQTNTYYVLRMNATYGDARSESCYQWTFFHSNEEDIYNDWYPADISEHGRTYSEDVADVPADQLGGGYFLVWHDFAAVNTETEVWNGVTDFVKNTGEFYSLRYRMWSNIIKQWNADINSSLTYANFATIRNTLGDFPGLAADTYSGASYAKAVTLPAATAPIKLGDHTALTQALATKIPQGSYSNESYAAYEAAYNNAVAVNNNNSATAEELGAALTALNNAIAGLTIRTYRINIICKAMINNTETTISSRASTVPASDSNYEIFLPYIDGYTFQRVEGSSFTPSESGDGSGYLTGTVSADTTITVWYENTVNIGRLNDLIDEAITSQTVSGDIKYTNSSWSAYTTALNNAKNFTLSTTTKQTDVDALVKALVNAQIGLVTDASNAWMEIEFLNDSFSTERQIGLYIQTSPNIKSLSVLNKTAGYNETPTFCSGEVQTLDDGTVVKYWILFFNLREAGNVTYEIIGTYTDGNTEKTVSKLI